MLVRGDVVQLRLLPIRRHDDQVDSVCFSQTEVGDWLAARPITDSHADLLQAEESARLSQVAGTIDGDSGTNTGHGTCHRNL